MTGGKGQLGGYLLDGTVEVLQLGLQLLVVGSEGGDGGVCGSKGSVLLLSGYVAVDLAFG